MRSAKCRCQMPVASQNGKLQMASGKLRGFADCKASQGVNNWRFATAYSSFLPQVKRRGDRPSINLKLKDSIFVRIYYPLIITESGRWVVPYATKERSWIVRFKCNKLTIKRYQKRTTVRNIPLGVPVNKPAHTTNYDGKRNTPIAERAEPRSLQGEVR